MEFIITKNGYCLTLRERKVMILMLDEVKEMGREREGASLFPDKDLENLHYQLGLFIKAVNEGYITRSELTICGP